MEEREAFARLVVVGGERILSQGILQSFQLSLRYVAGDGAVTEVLDNFWLEALINSTEVVALAVLELKRALVAITVSEIALCVRKVAIVAICFHRETAIITILE